MRTAALAVARMTVMVPQAVTAVAAQMIQLVVVTPADSKELEMAAPEYTANIDYCLRA
ncbi:hypothetical protein D9M68_816870 [compost metagenome]